MSKKYFIFSFFFSLSGFSSFYLFPSHFFFLSPSSSRPKPSLPPCMSSDPVLHLTAHPTPIQAPLLTQAPSLIQAPSPIQASIANPSFIVDPSHLSHHVWVQTSLLQSWVYVHDKHRSLALSLCQSTRKETVLNIWGSIYLKIGSSCSANKWVWLKIWIQVLFFLWGSLWSYYLWIVLLLIRG